MHLTQVARVVLLSFMSKERRKGFENPFCCILQRKGGKITEVAIGDGDGAVLVVVVVLVAEIKARRGASGGGGRNRDEAQRW